MLVSIFNYFLCFVYLWITSRPLSAGFVCITTVTIVSNWHILYRLVKLVKLFLLYYFLAFILTTRYWSVKTIINQRRTYVDRARWGRWWSTVLRSMKSYRIKYLLFGFRRGSSNFRWSIQATEPLPVDDSDARFIAMVSFFNEYYIKRLYRPFRQFYISPVHVISIAFAVSASIWIVECFWKSAVVSSKS